MGTPFCVKCGRPNDGTTPFIDHLCLKCFVEHTRLLELPSYIEYEYCKGCGSVRLGYKWIEAGGHERACELVVERLISEKVKPRHPSITRFRLKSLKFITEPSWRTLCSLTFQITLRGVDDLVEQDYVVELRAKPSLCPLCFDQRGGDYNAVIQLRGDLLRLQGLLEKIFSRKRLQQSLIDVVETKNGLDILLRDGKVALQVASEIKRRLNVEVVVSYEDVGITRTGKMRRRLSVSIHIPQESQQAPR